ncbi:MAG: hypothetical protein ACXAAI_08385 [Promethearchaeota archaeon]|jgi:hypothetical protein
MARIFKKYEWILKSMEKEVHSPSDRKLRRGVRIALVIIGILDLFQLVMNILNPNSFLGLSLYPSSYYYFYDLFETIILLFCFVIIPVLMIVFAIFLEYHKANVVLLISGIILIPVLLYFGIIPSIIVID